MMEELQEQGKDQGHQQSIPTSFNELKALPKKAREELWLNFFNEMPHFCDQQMLKIIWYKIQCSRHNLRIQQRHITRLNRYSKDPDKHIENAYTTKYHLKSGMEIVKVYKGREFRVYVKSSGAFVYNNRIYKTLSAAAKAICGKTVSGYDFFGLNNKHYKKYISMKKEVS